MEQYYMMKASSLLLYEVLLNSYRWWVCLFSKVSLLATVLYLWGSPTLSHSWVRGVSAIQELLYW